MVFGYQAFVFGHEAMPVTSGGPVSPRGRVKWERITRAGERKLYYRICSPGDPLHITPPRLGVEQPATTTSCGHEGAV